MSPATVARPGGGGPRPTAPRFAVVTLGCARNDVDSEELAGRLTADGWQAVDAASADVTLVNTCGFIAAAKKDSIDTLLEAAGETRDAPAPKVVAVGCLAERYGAELAQALPEAAAVLSFDDYPEISARLRGLLTGDEHLPHLPRDRRALLPIAPVERPRAAARAFVHESANAGSVLPGGPASGPRTPRQRLASGPVAPLKLASGCDRRCAFCAIPTFRGAFVSRPPGELLDEARWLAEQGVRELFLVSENSTSYGKDLGDVRLLESLLPEIATVAGIERVRVSYLQPAEMRPSLVEVITSTPGVVPYFDLSFQHASGPVLRRMRRFGDAERFLDLLATIRERSPAAGVRSNFIVGFPGETEEDVETLESFLAAARLDAVGIFGYSDEDGTEAAGLTDKVAEDTVRGRVDRVSRLAEELTSQRAEERVGEVVDMLVEAVLVPAVGGAWAEGRAAHQAPEVDGSTVLIGESGGEGVGDRVLARVVSADGVDLRAVRLDQRP